MEGQFRTVGPIETFTLPSQFFIILVVPLPDERLAEPAAKSPTSAAPIAVLMM
jgi:hypothetical protein